MRMQIRSWPSAGAVGKRKSGPRARSTNSRPSKQLPAIRLVGGARPAKDQRRQRTATPILATRPAPAQPDRPRHGRSPRHARGSEPPPVTTVQPRIIFTPHGVPKAPETGGQLHHQPGDAGILRDRVQSHRDADRSVGRSSGHACPAVGTVELHNRPGSQGAHMDAGFFRAWVAEIAAVVETQRDHLTQLDSAIGDADHGINLARGFGAVQAALAQASTPTPGSVLMLTGSTLISKVGGASGPLYGTAFRQAGKALGDVPEVDLAALAGALEAALSGVQKLGAAREGDKTMVDALAPAASVLSKAVAEGASLADALAALAEAADAGAQATIPMQALKGWASYLGPRSVGHEDPGAVSTALIMHALRDVAVRQAR